MRKEKSEKLCRQREMTKVDYILSHWHSKIRRNKRRIRCIVIDTQA